MGSIGIGNFQISLSWLDRKTQQCGMEKAISNMRKKKEKEKSFCKKKPIFFLDNVNFIKVIVTVTSLILCPPKLVELL